MQPAPAPPAETTASPLARATGIHHAAYRCRDAEQTRWFYEDVLGLPLTMTLVEEEVPGLGDKVPFMHLFFELGNGGFIAFFDQPGSATPEHFRMAHSFDRHIAFEVPDEATLRAWQKRINGMGVSCFGPLDHEFVRSIYMYDPNGLQVELTVRQPAHDRIMAEQRASNRDTLKAWSARMRAEKEAKFGAEALDQRSRHVRPGG